MAYLMIHDKRNKLICLTESGMEYTKVIDKTALKRNICQFEKMGLENIESLMIIQSCLSDFSRKVDS